MSWNRVSLINSRLSRVINTNNNLLYRNSLRSFSGHGPPTRFGMPHVWGQMTFGYHKPATLAVMFCWIFAMLRVIDVNYDTIVYPAHKFNNEANMGRNW